MPANRRILGVIVSGLLLLNPWLDAWARLAAPVSSLSQISREEFAYHATQGFFEGTSVKKNSFSSDLAATASRNCGSDTDVERYMEAYRYWRELNEKCEAAGEPGCAGPAPTIMEFQIPRPCPKEQESSFSSNQRSPSDRIPDEISNDTNFQYSENSPCGPFKQMAGESEHDCALDNARDKGIYDSRFLSEQEIQQIRAQHESIENDRKEAIGNLSPAGNVARVIGLLLGISGFFSGLGLVIGAAVAAQAGLAVLSSSLLTGAGIAGGISIGFNFLNMFSGTIPAYEGVGVILGAPLAMTWGALSGVLQAASFGLIRIPVMPGEHEEGASFLLNRLSKGSAQVADVLTLLAGGALTAGSMGAPFLASFAVLLPGFLANPFVLGGVTLVSLVSQSVIGINRSIKKYEIDKTAKHIKKLHEESQSEIRQIESMDLEPRDQKEWEMLLNSVTPPSLGTVARRESLKKKLERLREEEEFGQEAARSLGQFRADKTKELAQRQEERVQKLLAWQEELHQIREEPFDPQNERENILKQIEQGQLPQMQRQMGDFYRAKENDRLAQEAHEAAQQAQTKQEYEEAQERFAQSRQNVRSSGYAILEDVSQEDIGNGRMDLIALSHGMLSIGEGGQIERKSPDEEQKEEYLEKVRQDNSFHVASGEVVSMEYELRDYSPQTKAARDAGCSDKNPCLRIHEGVDIANESATEVAAPKEGVVIVAGDAGDQENRILISHGVDQDGNLVLSGILHSGQRNDDGSNDQGSGILTKAGETVARGEVIALMGDSGGENVQGHPHVHIEYFVVPRDAEDREDIEKAIAGLENLGEKYNGGVPPKELNDDGTPRLGSDFEKWKNAHITIKDLLLDKREPIGTVVDQDGKTKRVFIRTYGAYNQNEYIPIMRGWEFDRQNDEK